MQAFFTHFWLINCIKISYFGVFAFLELSFWKMVLSFSKILAEFFEKLSFWNIFWKNYYIKRQNFRKVTSKNHNASSKNFVFLSFSIFPWVFGKFWPWVFGSCVKKKPALNDETLVLFPRSLQQKQTPVDKLGYHDKKDFFSKLYNGQTVKTPRQRL